MSAPKARNDVLFREEALRRAASVEDLDRYIKVANPGAWAIALAVAALLVAAIIWAATANIPVEVSMPGVVLGDTIYCYVPADESIEVTKDSIVEVAGFDSQIIEVHNSMPLSKREVAEQVGDYVSTTLGLGEWSFLVEVAVPKDLNDTIEVGMDVPVTIVTQEVPPISYLFGGE